MIFNDFKLQSVLHEEDKGNNRFKEAQKLTYTDKENYVFNPQNEIKMLLKIQSPTKSGINIHKQQF